MSLLASGRAWPQGLDGTIRGFTVGRFAVDSALDSKVDFGSRFSEASKSTDRNS